MPGVLRVESLQSTLGGETLTACERKDGSFLCKRKLQIVSQGPSGLLLSVPVGSASFGAGICSTSTGSNQQARPQS